jgi:predicted RND superfamily exporter protein
VYALSLAKNLNESKPVLSFQRFTDSVITKLKSGQKSKSFHFAMALLIFIGLYGVINVKIDNYLTDEINKKSEIYKQTVFFDSHFGGIKPITIFLDKESGSDLDVLSQVEKSIKELGFVVDFSNTNTSRQS